MGRDKATLPFGDGETMLARVIRVLQEVVPPEHVVCVAAPGQSLPALPAGTRVVFDEVPGAGPLPGLASGLRAMAGDVEAVYVTGCDSARLAPALVARMFERLGDSEIAAPHDGRHWHPLAGVYRTTVANRVEELLAAGERRVTAVLETCAARPVPVVELRDVDPELASLATCNTPDEYQAALRRAEVV
jgi:molybdopterin-guanine dinucleotide biosynthesis protein A